jgi:type II restriction enzyme
MFNELIAFINVSAYNACDFKKSTEEVRSYLDTILKKDFLDIVRNIGTIPESIEHDSTEEKLYSKASDIVLARCFRLLGLESKALDERADSADIIANSKAGYQYSLVADAKCFRLSRTAKNQKDFKVSNLSDWRGAENEYAILVSPYYQYPSVTSQIYSKALDSNVCLLSWEHISILLENNISETVDFSLESIWNASTMIARDRSLIFAMRKNNLMPKMDSYIANKLNITFLEYSDILQSYKINIVHRGNSEISYWNEKIREINNYTRERAIKELISAQKLNEKISAIRAYVNKLNK